MEATDDLHVEAMSATNLSDLRTLLLSPPEGWCWCVAWEVPGWDGWKDRTADMNHTLREHLWSEGQYHGFLFYVGRQPVGWCRVGPTSVWPKLCRERNVPPSDEVYAFTCFGMRPEFRKRGLTHEFLRQVLDRLRSRGIRRVVAFPKHTSETSRDGELWNGPFSLYKRAGFSITRPSDRFYVASLALN